MQKVFGLNEVMDLLNASILSRTPLTDTILNKSRINFTWPSDPLKLLPKVEKEAATNSFKRIILKVFVQKSTNKLLFAQADEEFIDFLFGLLTIPLGGVERLMDGSSSVTNIGNLYKSVLKLDVKYFKSVDAMIRLHQSTLAHGYRSASNILPLREEKAPKVYYYEGERVNGDFMSFSNNIGGPCAEVRSSYFPNKNGSYVRNTSTYMVSDDLIVTPLRMTSCISILNALKIPISDVTKTELHVGLDEALSILKASLVSISALSNGLNHLLTKQP